jgi:hypothetical protein
MSGPQRQKPHWMAILAVIAVGIFLVASPVAVISQLRTTAGSTVVLMVVVIVMLTRHMQRI